MSIHYPSSPTEGGKLTSKLTQSNWKKASSIRYHEQAGFIRIYIVGHRYFDRGAGGFMGGGAYVYEGHVFCECYPSEPRDKSKVPEIKSVAGWGSAGSAQATDGTTVDFADPKNRKTYVDSLSKEFWSVEEALSYANGEDGGTLAQESESVRVTWTKSGYKVRRNDA